MTDNNNISYNKKYNKCLICNISLIKNENIETFKCIINHLKETYNFNPKIMTVDFCKAAYITFKNMNTPKSNDNIKKIFFIGVAPF